MRFLQYPDLRERGIKYTRVHINRLVNLGLFPRPFKTGVGTNGPNNWTEEQIDRYQAECAAKAVAAE